MGCLPSINWCRISQPSRVWCFSSTLNKHQHHSKRRRSASQTSKNYGYIWLHYHFSSMFFFLNDLLVLNFTYVGWLDGLLGVGWLIARLIVRQWIIRKFVQWNVPGLRPQLLASILWPRRVPTEVLHLCPEPWRTGESLGSRWVYPFSLGNMVGTWWEQIVFFFFWKLMVSSFFKEHWDL